MPIDHTSHAFYIPYMILCLSYVIIINQSLYYKILITYLVLDALSYLLNAPLVTNRYSCSQDIIKI